MFKQLFVAVAVGILLVPAISQAQFKAGDLSLTVTGAGSNDKDFNNGSFGVQGGLGYFLTKEVEAGVRQGLGWGSSGNNSSWNGSTRVYADYNIDMDRLVPFVGLSAGYNYGDDTADGWIGGPEGGLKYFINSTTFIYGQVGYDFILDQDFDEGNFVYSVGLGVNL